MSCFNVKDIIMENCVTCYMDEAELELWNNNKKIEKQLKKDFKESQSMKILLLGTGEAGKSTFIKQMKIVRARSKLFPGLLFPGSGPGTN